MKEKFDILDRTIGDDDSLFILAECGITCNYEMDTTKKLIEVVAESEADAIKLIFCFPEEVHSNHDVEYEYETVDGKETENLYEASLQRQFTIPEWQELINFAEERDVLFFCSVGSPSGVEYAQTLDIPVIKMGSWEFNNYPVWKEVVRLDKPIFIDTGPVNTTEVSKVLDLMRDADNEEAALIHCYHTDDPSQMNMRAIPYMADTFGTPVGFSSPGRDRLNDVMALALGASIIEKRLTLSRKSTTGHHHAISLEPDEFHDYAKQIKKSHRALGEFGLKPSQDDLNARQKWFMRIVADKPLQKGDELNEEDMAAKRPANGVSPEFLEKFKGFKLNKDINYNEPITWEDLK